MSNNLPVAMYHMVNNWPTKQISLSPLLFEKHCRALVKGQWHTVTLEEAENYFLEGRPLPRKSVWITFDDGYLDNYVYAYPILKKYGLKGTIFCTVERMEHAGNLRPTVQDVWEKRIRTDELPRVDTPYVPHALGYETRSDLFLNWSEVRDMDASGVVQIASHSLTHGNVFINAEYDGFIRPGPRHRAFDRLDYPKDIPWGLPNFSTKGALRFRAFLPSERLVNGVRAIVPQDKAEAYHFFQNPDNLKHLEEFVASIPKAELGEYESDAAMRARLEHDMDSGKKRLEEELGHPVRTLCWPWGRYMPESFEAAKQAGYRVLVTTEAGTNRPVVDAEHVARFHVKTRSAGEMMFRYRMLQSPLLAKIYASIRI